MAMAMRNFDTLRSFNTLKARGMPEDTAEALVEMIKEATDSSIEHLATKDDLLLTEAKLRQEMAEGFASVRQEMAEGLASVRQEMNENFVSVRGEISTMKEDISELKAGMRLMQRLFFGGTLTILLAIAALFFHG